MYETKQNKDNLVLTIKGYTEIRNIVKGDTVLSLSRKYERVLKTTREKVSDICRVKTSCSEDLLVSKEHEFYVRKKIIDTSCDYKKKYFYSTPTWKKTEGLTNDYYLGVAINTERKFPDFYELEREFSNANFWWLVGFYYRRGWIKDNKISILCSIDEYEKVLHAASDLDLLDDNFRKEERAGTYVVCIANKHLVEFLSRYGVDRETRKLNGDIMNLSEHYLKCFLQGYMKNGSRDNSIVCNRGMAYGLGKCFLKVYNTPYEILVEDDLYVLSLYEEIQEKTYFDGEYMWYPIEDIVQEEFNDYRYNFKVTKSNSYTINNVIVRNDIFVD